MENESNIPRGQHCIFNLNAYFILIEKYRRRVFDARATGVLLGIFAGVCADAQATPLKMDAEDDHVHLLVEYPPKLTLSSLVNSLKGVSSRLLR